MEKPRAVDVERLEYDVHWAMSNGLGPRDLVPMLERLARHAERGSNAYVFARLQLAELLVERAPWRAALLARQVLAETEHDRAWGILGLAHTVLGNYRAARKAYYQALALCPESASYAHNLGHLLDVVFERPREARRLLRAAHQAEPEIAEISASYARALARAGEWKEAKRLLEQALGTDGDAAEGLLRSWLRPPPP